MRFTEHQHLAALFLCVALGACAGRTPAPVAVVQERDQNADCATIVSLRRGPPTAGCRFEGRSWRL